MIAQTQKKSEFIVFDGGVDFESPAYSIKPGFIRDSINVEHSVIGGYQSIEGYERFDGKAKPSDASYQVLPFSNAGTVVVGNTITGATSGATAVVVAIRNNCFIVTKITGTWTSEATTTYSAVISLAITVSDITTKESSYYKALAADSYRADIQAVPGSGSILGVWYYKGVAYAFRNKVTTGVDLYKSTSSGWTAVDLGYEVPFSNANDSVNEGDTLTSGGTAIIKRVVVESGTLSSGTNTGRLILGAPIGSVIAGAATSTGGGTLTLTAGATAITIPNANGRYEFVNANFTGSASTQRMYGCDGVNRPFEFDGSVFVQLQPISTTVYPSHVAAHRNHLFFSYKSSLIHSAIGDPYNYTTTAGGGELAVSDDVTGLMVQPGSETTASMAVFCRNSSYMLYGSDAGTWELQSFNDATGGYSYTVQKIGGQTFFVDDRGLISLNSAKEYGNFLEATVSQKFQSWLYSRKSTVTETCVSKRKSQYRIFFESGEAAYITITNKGLAMMPVVLPDVVKCACSTENATTGDELILFGSDNGMVYQMDIGTSFDSSSIEWYFSLVFNHSNAYQVLKRYRRITYEITGYGYSEFVSGYSLGYRQSSVEQPNTVLNVLNLSLSRWDEFIWDSFTWDSITQSPISMSITGVAENMSIQLSSNSNYFLPIKFSGALVEYSPLRTKR